MSITLHYDDRRRVIYNGHRSVSVDVINAGGVSSSSSLGWPADGQICIGEGGQEFRITVIVHD